MGPSGSYFFDVGQDLGQFFFFCTHVLDEAPKTHYSTIFSMCELLGFSL
jgi:hypothetical protein